MAKKLEAVVIADDLTGGADTGVQFCPVAGRMYLKHYSTETLACENGLPGGLAIFTNSRHVDAVEAGRRVAAGVAGVGEVLPALIYKKIDSCLRGNIGAELDALMRQSGAETSFVAPAFPGQGRTTRDDVHLLDGVPVALTEMGRDPLCPVKESRISLLLGAQSDLAVGHLGLAWLDRGVAEAENRLRQLTRRGCRHIVFDALNNEHLRTIAALARRQMQTAPILLVGSAGLASAVAKVTATKRRDRGRRDRARPRRSSVGRWLLVCGSASQVMRRQVARLAAQTDVTHIVLQPENQGGAGGSLVESSGQGSAVQERSSTGTLLSLAPISEKAIQQVKPQQAAATVAEKAASLLQDDVYDGLFLSGGDTAEAVLGQIGASGICLQEEIVPGLVLGAVVGGDCHGLLVVTKAGAFGSDDALLELIQELK